jgi:hypothetical protein
MDPSRSKSADRSKAHLRDLARFHLAQRAVTHGIEGLASSEVISLQRMLGNQLVGELLRKSSPSGLTVEELAQSGIAGPGRPLEYPIRAEMESRFGHDFSRVRIHTEVAAEGAATTLDARAYTAGNNIVFGAGQYAPSTEAGRRLLAHELAHVVQQTRGGAPPPARAGSPHEHAAEAAASAAMAGWYGAVDVGVGTGVGVARAERTPPSASAAERAAMEQRRAAAAKQREAARAERDAAEAERKLATAGSTKRAASLRAEAVRKRGEAGKLRAEALEFESGRKSFTEVIPSAEEFEAKSETLTSESKPTGPEKAAYGERFGERLRDPSALPRLDRPLESDPRRGTRTVYRVQGPENRRVTVGPDGSVHVRPGRTLYGNFGSLERAKEFLRKGPPGREIVAFEVQEAWVQSLRSAAIPEVEGTKVLKGKVPKLVDVRFGDDQFEIPGSYVADLQDAIVPNSGRPVPTEPPTGGPAPARRAPATGGRGARPGTTAKPPAPASKAAAAPSTVESLETSASPTASPAPASKAPAAKAAPAVEASPVEAPHTAAAPTPKAAKGLVGPKARATAKGGTFPTVVEGEGTFSTVVEGQGTFPTVVEGEGTIPSVRAKGLGARPAPPKAPRPRGSQVARPAPPKAPRPRGSQVAKPAPPKAGGPSPASSGAEAARMPAASEVEPSLPKAGAGGTPGKAGKVWRGAKGLAGFALPIVLGWIHQRAVENRIREQVKREGYASPGDPSGLGRVYDLWAWLVDPGREAEQAVGIEQRFDMPVWRARLRSAAASRKTGDTLSITWDVGQNKFDVAGNQEIERREVVWRKQADGKWVVDKGDPSGTPNINDVISTDVPDSQLEKIMNLHRA